MHHPHIVQFYYCLQSASKVYLIMEYIRGGTLKRILRVSHAVMRRMPFTFGGLQTKPGHMS